MGAESDQVEATHIAIVIFAVHLPNVAVAIGPHELVQLLPQRVHGVKSPQLLVSFTRRILGFGRDWGKKNKEDLDFLAS